jgi:hypothetical protein
MPLLIVRRHYEFFRIFGSLKDCSAYVFAFEWGQGEVPDTTILELRQMGFGLIWSNLQWWASISFGLMALTRFSAKHLNLVIVWSLSILYFLFSVFTILNIAMLISTSMGLGEDLAALRDAGTLSSAGLKNLTFTETWAPVNGFIIVLCGIATFSGTISYLVYAYRKEARATSDA